MALGHLTITLKPGVGTEEFERFARDELLPAAKTVIRSRLGRVPVRHTILAARPNDGDVEPRTYLWRIEQRVFGNERYAFPTDLGTALKARLEEFGTLRFETAEDGYDAVVAQTDEEFSTPVLESMESVPEGWVTPQPERDQF